MKKSDMTKEERILAARRKGWMYIREFVWMDFPSYCAYLDKISKGWKPESIWMTV